MTSGAPSPSSSTLVETKALGRRARRAGRVAGGLVRTSNGRTWDPSKHPRDSNGRFIETGGTARVWGGGRGRVVRTLPRNRVEVEFGNGSRRVYPSQHVTMLSRPNGGKPIKDNGSDKNRRLIEAEDARRARAAKRGNGVDQPDRGDRDGDGVPDDVDLDPDNPSVRTRIADEPDVSDEERQREKVLEKLSQQVADEPDDSPARRHAEAAKAAHDRGDTDTFVREARAASTALRGKSAPQGPAPRRDDAPEAARAGDAPTAPRAPSFDDTQRARLTDLREKRDSDGVRAMTNGAIQHSDGTGAPGVTIARVTKDPTRAKGGVLHTADGKRYQVPDTRPLNAQEQVRDALRRGEAPSLPEWKPARGKKDPWAGDGTPTAKRPDDAPRRGALTDQERADMRRELREADAEHGSKNADAKRLIVEAGDALLEQDGERFREKLDAAKAAGNDSSDRDARRAEAQDLSTAAAEAMGDGNYGAAETVLDALERIDPDYEVRPGFGIRQMRDQIDVMRRDGGGDRPQRDRAALDRAWSEQEQRIDNAVRALSPDDADLEQDLERIERDHRLAVGDAKEIDDVDRRLKDVEAAQAQRTADRGNVAAPGSDGQNTNEGDTSVEDGQPVRGDGQGVLGDVPPVADGADRGPDGVLPRPGDAGEGAGRRDGDGAGAPRAVDQQLFGPEGMAAGDRGERGGDRAEGPGVPPAGAGDGDGQPAQHAGVPGGVAPERGEPAPTQRGTRRAPRTARSATGAVSKARGKNLKHSGQENLAPSDPAERLEANMNALRLLRKLQTEDRQATPAEQRALARWSGWGALPHVFDEKRPEFEATRKELRALMSDTEYRAARKNTLNAHYTDPKIVDAVWKAVRDLGFSGGDVLEPGSGSGNFIGRAPEGARMTGVELDSTTAALARQVYPEAEIFNESFGRSPFNEEVFDAVVGNVPFGNFPVHDPRYNPDNRHSIHNGFIIKGLAELKPGGVMAVVTSSFTLDGADDTSRKEMAKYGDLLGAVRLPAGTHRDTAGTDVVTDVLVFRRRKDGEKPGDLSWLKSSPAKHADGSPVLGIREKDGTARELDMNDWLAARPENVLGDVADGGYNGIKVTPRGDTMEGLDKALASITASARDAGRSWNPDLPEDGAGRRVMRNSGESREGKLALVGEKRTKKGKTEVVEYEFESVEDGKVVKHDVPSTQQDELKRLLEIRDLVGALDEAERGTKDPRDGVVTDLRRRLNRAYDDYVAKYGPITRRTEKVTPAEYDEHGVETKPEKITRTYPRMGGFRGDLLSADVLALEHDYDPLTNTAKKADVFDKRQTPIGRDLPTKAENPRHAVELSMEGAGNVDLDRVAALLETDRDGARKAIDEFVFEEPGTGRLVLGPMYKAGNVRRKYEAAVEAADRDPRFQKNVDALREVLPKEAVLGDDFNPKLGASYITPEQYNAFLSHLLNTGRRLNGIKRSQEGNGWDVYVPDTAPRDYSQEHETWGTPQRSVFQLLSAVMNGRHHVIKVETKDPDGTKHYNPTASAAAMAKAQEIEAEFTDWLAMNGPIAAAIQQKYTDTFRSIVPQDWSGSRERAYPGMAEGKKLRPHQNDAVNRALSTPATLLEHVVGSGKTYTMASIAMELRRTGQSKKPAMAVPNALLDQWAREYKDLYPGAKLLIVDSESLKSPQARRQFAAKAKNSDWDTVIFSYEAFEKIPVHEETLRNYMRRETDLLERQLATARAGRKTATVKQIEKKIADLEAKIEKELESKKDDAGIAFEDLGIDHVLVDEAHNFKNLQFTSTTQGVQAGQADRARDMHMKLESLRERAPKDGTERIATFATGTPVSNSLAEMYTVTRMLRPDLLRDANIEDFDSWAAVFANVTKKAEIGTDGVSVVEVPRFRGFTDSLGDALRIWREFADTQTAEKLKLPVPKLRGGARRVHIVEMSEAQRKAQAAAQARVRALPRGRAKKGEDTHVAIIGDRRRAGLDPRLMSKRGREAAGITQDDDFDSPKFDRMADEIAGLWQRVRNDEFKVRHSDPDDAPKSPNRGGLQMVIMDSTSPAAKGGTNGYEMLRERLVARGMDPKRIAFIQDAKTPQEKRAMHEGARQGEYDVIIGSTAALGTGTNVQNRLAHLHHAEGSWKPSDIEQREGRILRQGNQYGEVGIDVYVTPGMGDDKTWELTAAKQHGLDEIQNGDLDTIRSVEFADDVDPLNNFDGLAGDSSENKLIAERREVNADVKRFAQLERSHARSVSRAKENARLQSSVIRARERDLATLERAKPMLRDTTGDEFAFTFANRPSSYAFTPGSTVADRQKAADMLAGNLGEYINDRHLRVGDEGYQIGHVAELGGLRVTATMRKTTGGKHKIDLDFTTSTREISDRLPFESVSVNAEDLKSKEGRANVMRRLEGRLRGFEQAERKVREAKEDAEQRLGSATQAAQREYRFAAEQENARRRDQLLNAMLTGKSDNGEALSPGAYAAIEKEFEELKAAAGKARPVKASFGNVVSDETGTYEKAPTPDAPSTPAPRAVDAPSAPDTPSGDRAIVEPEAMAEIAEAAGIAVPTPTAPDAVPTPNLDEMTPAERARLGKAVEAEAAPTMANPLLGTADDVKRYVGDHNDLDDLRKKYGREAVWAAVGEHIEKHPDVLTPEGAEKAKDARLTSTREAIARAKQAAQEKDLDTLLERLEEVEALDPNASEGLPRPVGTFIANVRKQIADRDGSSSDTNSNAPDEATPDSGGPRAPRTSTGAPGESSAPSRPSDAQPVADSGRESKTPSSASPATASPAAPSTPDAAGEGAAPSPDRPSTRSGGDGTRPPRTPSGSTSSTTDDAAPQPAPDQPAADAIPDATPVPAGENAPLGRPDGPDETALARHAAGIAEADRVAALPETAAALEQARADLADARSFGLDDMAFTKRGKDLVGTWNGYEVVAHDGGRRFSATRPNGTQVFNDANAYTPSGSAAEKLDAMKSYLHLRLSGAAKNDARARRVDAAAAVRGAGPELLPNGEVPNDQQVFEFGRDVPLFDEVSFTSAAKTPWERMGRDGARFDVVGVTPDFKPAMHENVRPIGTDERGNLVGELPDGTQVTFSSQTSGVRRMELASGSFTYGEGADPRTIRPGTRVNAHLLLPERDAERGEPQTRDVSGEFLGMDDTHLYVRDAETGEIVSGPRSMERGSWNQTWNSSVGVVRRYERDGSSEHSADGSRAELADLVAERAERREARRAGLRETIDGARREQDAAEAREELARLDQEDADDRALLGDAPPSDARASDAAAPSDAAATVSKPEVTPAVGSGAHPLTNYDPDVRYETADGYDHPYRTDDEWVVYRATRPLVGDETWRGGKGGGAHYAAVRRDSPEFDRFDALNRRDAAQVVQPVTNEQSLNLAIGNDRDRFEEIADRVIDGEDIDLADLGSMLRGAYELPWSDSDETGNALWDAFVARRRSGRGSRGGDGAAGAPERAPQAVGPDVSGTRPSEWGAAPDDWFPTTEGFPEGIIGGAAYRRGRGKAEFTIEGATGDGGVIGGTAAGGRRSFKADDVAELVMVRDRDENYAATMERGLAAEVDRLRKAGFADEAARLESMDREQQARFLRGTRQPAALRDTPADAPTAPAEDAPEAPSVAHGAAGTLGNTVDYVDDGESVTLSRGTFPMNKRLSDSGRGLRARGWRFDGDSKTWSFTGTPEQRERALRDVADADNSPITPTSPDAPQEGAKPKYPPTPEQQAVIDAALDGKDVVVRALAGTGKTSTLVALAEAMQQKDPKKQAIYVAFNKAIQLEAADRMPGNVEARTANSLAFNAVPKWMQERWKERDRAVRSDRDVARVLGINDPVRVGGDTIEQDRAAGLVKRAVANYLISDDDEIGQKHFPIGEGDTAAALLPYARKAWADAKSPDGELALTQDHMVKLWALSRPDLTKRTSGVRKAADVVFFDEAQDINPVLAKVVADQKIQKVYVGDSNQAIYGFRGASDQLDRVQADADLPLTKSWRFGPAVADAGNRFLELLGSPHRVEGGGPESRIVQDMGSPDAILTRTNAGMLGEAMAVMEADRKVGVPAGTKSEFESVVRTVRYLQGTGSRPRTLHEDLAEFSTWQEVARAAEEGDNPKVQMLHRLVDRTGIDTLEGIVGELVEADKGTGKFPEPVDVTISTAHKSKGLEWDRVKIANDFPVPEVDDEGNVTMPEPEELRLAYVAVTRAKGDLDPGGLGWVYDYTKKNGGVPGEEQDAPELDESVRKADANTTEAVADADRVTVDPAEVAEIAEAAGIAMPTPAPPSPASSPDAVDFSTHTRTQDDHGTLLFAEGTRVATATGATTTPFPKTDFSTSRRGINSRKRADEWLVGNARDEAARRGMPDYALPKEGPYTPADREMAEDILFSADLAQRPVTPEPTLKPWNPSAEAPSQMRKPQSDTERRADVQAALDALPDDVDLSEHRNEAWRRSISRSTDERLRESREINYGHGSWTPDEGARTIRYIDNELARRAAEREASEASDEPGLTDAVNQPGTLDGQQMIDVDGGFDLAQETYTPPAPKPTSPRDTPGQQTIDDLLDAPDAGPTRDEVLDSPNPDGGNHVDMPGHLIRPGDRVLARWSDGRNAGQREQDVTAVRTDKDGVTEVETRGEFGRPIVTRLARGETIPLNRRHAGRDADAPEADRPRDRKDDGDRDGEQGTRQPDAPRDRDDSAQQRPDGQSDRDGDGEESDSDRQRDPEPDTDRDRTNDERDGDDRDRTNDERDGDDREEEDPESEKDPEERARKRRKKERKEKEKAKRRRDNRRRRRGGRNGRGKNRPDGNGLDGLGLPHLGLPDLPRLPKGRKGRGSGDDGPRGEGAPSDDSMPSVTIPRPVDPTPGNELGRGEVAVGRGEAAGNPVRDLQDLSDDELMDRLNAAWETGDPDVFTPLEAEFDRRDAANPLSQANLHAASLERLSELLGEHGHDDDAIDRILAEAQRRADSGDAVVGDMSDPDTVEAVVQAMGSEVEAMTPQDAAALERMFDRIVDAPDDEFAAAVADAMREPEIPTLAQMERDVRAHNDGVFETFDAQNADNQDFNRLEPNPNAWGKYLTDAQINALRNGNGVPATVLGKHLPEEITKGVWGMSPEEMQRLGFTPLPFPGTISRDDWIKGVQDQAEAAAEAGRRYAQGLMDGRRDPALTRAERALAFDGDGPEFRDLDAEHVLPGDLVVHPKTGEVREVLAAQRADGETGLITRTDGLPEVDSLPAGTLLQVAASNGREIDPTGPTAAPARLGADVDEHGSVVPAGNPSAIDLTSPDGVLDGLYGQRVRAVDAATGRVLAGDVGRNDSTPTIGGEPVRGEDLAELSLLSGRANLPGRPVRAGDLPDGARVLVPGKGRDEHEGTLGRDNDGTLTLTTPDGDTLPLGDDVQVRPMTAYRGPLESAPRGQRPGQWTAVEGGASTARVPGKWDATVVPSARGHEWAVNAGNQRVTGSSPSERAAKAAVEAVLRDVQDEGYDVGTLPFGKRATPFDSGRPDQPDDAPSSLGGRRAEWVNIADVNLGDTVRVAGNDGAGAPATEAGHALSYPTPVTVHRRGAAGPEDVYAIVVGENADGTGKRKVVYAGPDAAVARAVSEGPDEQRTPDQAEAAVLSGGVQDYVPVDPSGNGLFPGAPVRHATADRAGFIVSARQMDAQVRWEDGEYEDVPATSLRADGSSDYRPDGWTVGGRRILPGQVATFGSGQQVTTHNGQRSEQARGTVVGVDGDTVTLLTPSGLREAPASRLTVLSDTGRRVETVGTDRGFDSVVTAPPTMSDVVGEVAPELSAADRDALVALGFDIDGVTDPLVAEAAARIRHGAAISREQAAALADAVREATGPASDRSWWGRSMRRLARTLDSSLPSGNTEGRPVTVDDIGPGDLIAIPDGDTLRAVKVERVNATSLDVVGEDGVPERIGYPDEIRLLPDVDQVPVSTPRSAEDELRERTMLAFKVERARNAGAEVGDLAASAAMEARDLHEFRELAAQALTPEEVDAALRRVGRRTYRNLDNARITGEHREEVLAESLAASNRAGDEAREAIVKVLNDLEPIEGMAWEDQRAMFAEMLREHGLDAGERAARTIPLRRVGAQKSVAEQVDEIDELLDRLVESDLDEQQRAHAKRVLREVRSRALRELANELLREVPAGELTPERLQQIIALAQSKVEQMRDGGRATAAQRRRLNAAVNALRPRGGRRASVLAEVIGWLARAVARLVEVAIRALRAAVRLGRNTHDSRAAVRASFMDVVTGEPRDPDVPRARDALGFDGWRTPGLGFGMHSRRGARYRTIPRSAPPATATVDAPALDRDERDGGPGERALSHLREVLDTGRRIDEQTDDARVLERAVRLRETARAAERAGLTLTSTTPASDDLSAVRVASRSATDLADRAFVEAAEQAGASTLAALRQVRPFGETDGARLDLSGDAQAVAAVRWAAQHFPTDWLAAASTGPIKVQVGRRGLWDPQTRTLTVADLGGEHVAAGGPLGPNALHELTHVIESAVPDLGRAQWAYHYDRTSEGPVGGRVREGANATRSLADLYPVHEYQTGEFARTDTYPDPYMGREYGGMTHFEVMSMLMESLFGGSAHIDPQMRQFALGVLADLGGRR